jgi:hypothetical protein
MADAGKVTTKGGASAEKTSTSAKSGTSRSTASSAEKPSSKMSGARASRSKTSTAKKPSTAKGGATTTVRRRAERPSAARANGNGVDVTVPVLTPHLRTVHVPTPGMSYVEDAGRVVAGYLPSPGRLAFYGGLGVAAVVGLLDWPVAAAIGIGTAIARRTAGRGGAGRSQSRT